METIQLSIPNQDSSDSECVSLTVPVLESWLATLPQDTIISGTEIKQFLNRINKSQLENSNRYELMELFRPVTKNLCNSLITNYIHANIPLDEEKQQLATLNIQLITSLANGYKIAAIEACSKLKKFKESDKNSQQVVNTFQRTINNLCWLLLETYRIYWPEPTRIWQDLNQIYLYAEQLNIHTTTVSKFENDFETMLSIKQAYYRAVLLAIFNPYHLHKGEIASIYERIPRWANFVHITKPSKFEDLKDNCFIDMDEDKPPKFMFDGNSDINLDHVRVISQKDLVQILNNQINDSKKSTGVSASIDGGQLELYKRLLKALHPRQHRTSPRIPVSEKLTVANNLNACYYFINGRKDFSARIALPNEDVTQILDDSQEAEQQPTIWNQKNQSESGIAIFCPQRCGMHAHVGEVVAFHNAETSWHIGVIRWIKTRPNGGLEFGIFIFADSSQAIEVKAVRGESSSFNFFRAILAPNKNPMQNQVSVIVPPDIYITGTVILINLEDRVVHAILQELIEKGRDFERYAILPLHETIK